MWKKLFAIAFVVVFVFCSATVFVSAEELETPIEEELIEEYENTIDSSIFLFSQNGRAKITVSILGKSSTKFKSGTLKLYKYENGTWSTVKTWTNLSSSTNTFLFNDNTVAVQSGAKYKVKIAITAYTSSTSERIVLDTTKVL